MKSRAPGDDSGGEAPEGAAEQSDLELVRRAQRNERGAFDLLVLKYQHKVVKLVGSSRVDLQACKLEYSIVSPK